MRIISEIGKFDVPYEHAVVFCEGTMIYVGLEKRQWMFAQYSDREMAQKAMDMLHDAYEGKYSSFRFPSEEFFRGGKHGEA